MRLASCVSVEVVNGGAGRSTPGFCSTPVTVQGTFARTASTNPCVAVSSSRRTAVVLEGTGLRVEVLAGGDALVVDPNERGDELATLALQRGFEVPVLRRAERAPFFLALDDEPHRDALHAPGAQPCLHLLPQNGRKGVAVEPIENASALLRANEVLVDVARIVERLLHGVFRDFVKDDAADRNPAA